MSPASAAAMNLESVNSALKYLAGVVHPFISPARVGHLHQAHLPNSIFIRELCPKVGL
jgi:hypothetical protein